MLYSLNDSSFTGRETAAKNAVTAAKPVLATPDRALNSGITRGTVS